MGTGLAPTPRDEVHREGTARLLRFRRPTEGDRPAEPGQAPILLVPSLINRWYVLDLRAGQSLCAALVAAGLDTFCLDWGVPEDEDRHLGWDQVVTRLRRALRVVRRKTGATQVSLLGYCMGGTLAGIAAALDPDAVATLVNLAGPFDFAESGLLGQLAGPEWFDAAAIAAAGNVRAHQMQSAFQLLRPTGTLAKWVSFAERAGDAAFRSSFFALERWASDNIPFPAAAYATYIRELYQENRLVRGEHHVAGRRVDLGAIRCPVLVVVAARDTICPPPAARALLDRCTSATRELLVVPGGHVGAVVGSRAPSELYPRLVDWLGRPRCSYATCASS